MRDSRTRRMTGLAALAAVLGLAGSAFAGTAPPPPPPSSSVDTTRVFVGLNLVFGKNSQVVEGLAGVAYGNVSTSGGIAPAFRLAPTGGDVTGAKASAHFRLTDGFRFRKLKLTGLAGNLSIQAELGGGWDFENAVPFGVIGYNTANIHGGGDIKLGGGSELYFGAHTIGKF